ncbi:MAG: 50S ribosomal protein L4, partial [Bacteroidia bacterium]|nr:50S ribosomal protein L4 [Bacteroidia bacterium]
MELAVYNIQGQTTGETVELPDSIYGIEPNNHVIYLDVKSILANQRQGTHKTKERGEVSGSTKKPWKQKGTGNARAGHKRSPLWRHGGTIFGPRPRDYSFKVNAKVKQLARRSAIAYKLKDGKFTVLQDFTMNAPKTKEFVQIMKNLQAMTEKVLFVTPADTFKTTEQIASERKGAPKEKKISQYQNIILSGRNLPNLK